MRELPTDAMAFGIHVWKEDARIPIISMLRPEKKNLLDCVIEQIIIRIAANDEFGVTRLIGQIASGMYPSILFVVVLDLNNSLVNP